jgi:hypothetical protein
LTDHAAAADFKPRLVQHLRWSLGGLEEHRQVEDFHYFPVFRRAEPGSRRGSSCSSAITARCIPQTPASWSARDAVLMAEITDSARFRAALARFHDAHLELGRDLLRHLDDEEDPGDPAAAGARRACLRRWRLNDLVAAQVAHDVVVDRAPRPYRARALPSVRVLV